MIQKGNVGKSVGKAPEEQVKEKEFGTSEETRVAKEHHLHQAGASACFNCLLSVTSSAGDPNRAHLSG